MKDTKELKTKCEDIASYAERIHLAEEFINHLAWAPTFCIDATNPLGKTQEIFFSCHRGADADLRDIILVALRELQDKLRAAIAQNAASLLKERASEEQGN